MSRASPTPVPHPKRQSPRLKVCVGATWKLIESPENAVPGSRKYACVSKWPQGFVSVFEMTPCSCLEMTLGFLGPEMLSLAVKTEFTVVCVWKWPSKCVWKWPPCRGNQWYLYVDTTVVFEHDDTLSSPTWVGLSLIEHTSQGGVCHFVAFIVFFYIYIYIYVYIYILFPLSLCLYSLIVSLSPLNVIIWIQLIDVNALLRIGGRNLFVVWYSGRVDLWVVNCWLSLCLRPQKQKMHQSPAWMASLLFRTRLVQRGVRHGVWKSVVPICRYYCCFWTWWYSE